MRKDPGPTSSVSIANASISGLFFSSTSRPAVDLSFSVGFRDAPNPCGHLDMARIRWFLIISGVLVLMVFSLANTESVPIRMPFLFQRDAPLAMLLAISALIGFMVGALWTAWMLHRKKDAADGSKVIKPAAAEDDEVLG